MEGKILSEGAEIEIQSKEKKIFLNLKNNIKTGQNLIPDSFLIENILYEQKSCPWDPRSYTAKVLEREKKGEISLYCLQSPINGAFQSILLDQINLKFSSWSSKFPLGKYDLEKSPNMEGNYKVQGNKVILSHNEKEITLQVIMDPNDKIISFILGHKRPPMTQNDCNLFYPQKNENYFCSNAIEGKGSTILKLNLEENKFDLWAQSFEWTGIPKGPPMESGIISKTPKGIKISLNHKKIPITILKEDPQTQVPLEIEIEGNKLAPSLCRF
jgi:hypothetical protein